MGAFCFLLAQRYTASALCLFLLRLHLHEVHYQFIVLTSASLVDIHNQFCLICSSVLPLAVIKMAFLLLPVMSRVQQDGYPLQKPGNVGMTLFPTVGKELLTIPGDRTT